ncbi:MULTISPECIES: hypothetical protein [Paraliobacillus]|nr:MULTISPECIES: hypothetical protein [Paraliobacillus]
MTEKKSVFSKLFVKKEKDCCNVEIEEVNKKVDWSEIEKKSADKS